jgi:tRNA(Ile)-lysidine synthase
MNIALEPGVYVVAVSGGVDSVALLDLLVEQPKVKLAVAHFDHGIRPDSAVDRRFVQKLAGQYKLPFVYHEGHLGPEASEATARTARYKFLDSVKKGMGAQAVVTAHHQDDLLETAILNMLRGTGRKGLTSLKSTDSIRRPLLHLPKNKLIEYAQSKKLPWREDPTNQDTKYLRNYIRHVLLPKFSSEDRRKLLKIIEDQHGKNAQIDDALINVLHVQPSLTVLDRHWFTMLPHKLAQEYMATWLRHNGIRNFDRKTIERLIHAAKTLQGGRAVDVNGSTRLVVAGTQLALLKADR